MDQSSDPKARKPLLTFRTYQAIVLVLTFLAYAGYHATRKIPSIVKTALDPKPPASGWAPFDGPQGTAMLGELDVAFLSAYSISMYLAGHLGDWLDLRILLALGMVGTGLLTCLFGAGFWLSIHSFYYYLVVQVAAGVLQSTGWPSVVAIVGNWLGRKKRGLVMGVWNAHTSVGSITGSLVGSALLNRGWGWSFVVPGLAMGVLGLVVALLLPVSPEAVGVEREDSREKSDAEEALLVGTSDGGQEKVVGFLEAWRIPGVAPFALCLFFSKLVAYAFLYWLPFYISNTAIGGQYLSDAAAGALSTLFDVGGVAGGILAGHISDRLSARATTAAAFTYCAIPALLLYRVYGGASLLCNAALMFVAGAFINGPYALITTAVSADLGGGARAVATVAAIINGTGSVGAAVGPLLTGYVSAKSWGAVFGMLMAAALMAGLLLTQLVAAEVVAKVRSGRAPVGLRDP